MLKLANALIFLLYCIVLKGEVHQLTLRQAVELAVKQNPDMIAARMQEHQAQEAIRIAKDPFTPHVTIGSGLAYTSGFPMSIEGSGPSLVQARASQFLFNRPQNYVVAQAREMTRGANIGAAGVRQDVAFRTTSLYLDAERTARVAEMTRKNLESLEKVARTVDTRVQEGQALPIESKRSAYDVARAKLLLHTSESQQISAETLLAIAVGLGADDRVHPAGEERGAPSLPASEEAAVQNAVESSAALRRLQSRIAAKGLELRGEKAARLPRVDLVAQYALFSRFNNYEDYFRRFDRNNGQIGVSFQLPILPGPGVAATTAQTEGEIAQLRNELSSTRNRLIVDTRQAYREVERARMAREVANLDLQVARDQLSITLALMQEGRAPLRQVEEARVAESDKWLAFYDAEYGLERARWSLLWHTGELLAALK